MLEKIGLPAKPSLRGNNWVVDASHCQGCSSQFTFINRKHHCRRCGGIFCNSCSQQRMVLRGQGDSPVRICEPCKRLEEAARFELRHGQKSRAGRGSSRSMSKQDDEVLNKILGNNQKEALLSGLTHNNDEVSSMPRETSSASCSNSLEAATQDMREEILGNFSADESASPEELRQRASEEKKKYKTLKGQGKSEEALKAFKRGKDLERQAVALELYLRKNRKKASPTRKLPVVQDKHSPKESAWKNKVEKDDLASELRELGWSDMDLREDEKKPANVSLEGELFSLLGEVSQNTRKDKDSIDKTQVVALKKKALMLKREGKVSEAKEELKKAKVLEKQIEEQALLAEADDSDDELSALIRSMDSDKQDDLQIGYGQNLDFDRLVGVGDNLGIDSNLDVTDEDMRDPEIAAALESFGWTEDNYHPENIVSQYVPVNREAVLSEILSLKREALNKKRAGNMTEAMEHLKKAKVLEGDLENLPSLAPEKMPKSVKVNDDNVNVKTVSSKVSPKSRLVIQKELLGLKKRALALRREGKLDEAEEELKKGKVLELQLEEIDNAPKVNAKPVQVNTWDPDLAFKNPDISSNLPLGDAEDDVTDQDLQDPTYLSLLSNLGWKEEDSDHVNHPAEPSKPNGDLSNQNTDLSGTQLVSNNQARPSRRSKSEMQRELLSLKRKALALRRQGKSEEADEVLHMAKAIEAQMDEMEASKLQVQVESKYPIKTVAEEEDKVDVTDEDMNDPALLSVLNNLGWKDEEHKPINVQSASSDQISMSSIILSSAVSAEAPRSKGEIQRELLGLKRKALALRRQGKTEEAEELLRMSEALETQIEEMEAPKKTLDASSNEKPGSSGSSNKFEKHESLKDVAGSETFNPQLQTRADLVNQNPQIFVKGNPLLDHPDYARASESIASIYTSGGPMNSTTSSADTLQDKQNSVPYISSLTSTPPNQLGLLKGSYEGLVSEDKASTNKRDEKVHANEKQQIHEVNSGQGSSSPNNQSPLWHEILARKRTALALKREGKLAEAREELRQAKLLEKILDEGNSISASAPNDASVSTSTVTTIGQKEQVSAHLAPKPLSVRDRFKLQQESLGHKRQAMKLRREGRMEEAEAEFELAKALENQLEDSQDSMKSNAPTDDVGVEDLLDPELLSALKAIGLGDATNIVSERPEPTKHNAARSENSNQERVQLEGRIKAEKVKAVNLKRSGKQPEALDALRRAKQLEKKLNALV